MLTPFALFFGLTVATAVIAYWSDNLGKKLGKKRISLYGMRPRTTATVLTIASSWGIMLFTLIVMLLVFEPLRSALLRYDSVNRQKDTLAAQRDQLILQKEEIEKSLNDQQKRLERVEKQAGLAGINARKAENAAKESQRQQDLAVKREALARRSEKNAINSERSAKLGAAAATKRAENARQGEIAAKAQAQLASANLGQVQSQLQQNKERLEQARDALANTNGELNRANEQLKAAQSRFKNAQERLKVATDDLDRIGKEAIKAGQQANKAFGEAEAAKKEFQLAQQKVDALNKQRQDLEKRIRELNQTVDQLYVLATSPVLITYNQTLAARTLPKGLAPSRIESHLRSLFKVAQETGQRLLDNDRVEVILVQDVESSNGNEPTKIPDEQVYSSAADFIAASNREVSVRIVSRSNFAQGEPFIYVRFQMVEVKKAVSTGEVLASRTIDSKSGDSSIFASLLDLVEVGRGEATRRGVNPPQSADDPNFYENGTNEQIFEALRKIEKIGGTPTVSIVATDDLSTVEPIRVRFEVS